MADSTVTFKGYPGDVLDRIFEAVGGNPEDIAEPFAALVPANMVDVVCAAIEWVAVFPPIVIPKEDGLFLVISEGDGEGSLHIVSSFPRKGKEEIDD